MSSEGGVWNRVGVEWRGLGKIETRVLHPDRPGARLTWLQEEILISDKSVPHRAICAYDYTFRFNHQQNDRAMKTNFPNKLKMCAQWNLFGMFR